MTTPTRQPHAIMDLPSRRQKALKIEKLLNLDQLPQPIRMLEVGTGSGAIAHYFATHSDLDCEVSAIDVLDHRAFKRSFSFKLVDGTALPYRDNSFDVILTNHVIEHVGNRSEQFTHLKEIHRVLKPKGVGYLAVPNRWMVVEPHYRVAFLSWLPRPWRSRYLRLARRGTIYDCEPLRLPELDRLLRSSGFHFQHLEIEAFRQTLAIEGTLGPSASLARRMPDKLLAILRPLIPTLICRIEKTQNEFG